MGPLGPLGPLGCSQSCEQLVGAARHWDVPSMLLKKSLITCAWRGEQTMSIDYSIENTRIHPNHCMSWSLHHVNRRT